MAQESENAFMTTTSCLPAYIQPSKWHLIAQCVAMVTFISHILKCTHKHTRAHAELEGSQAPSFNETQTLSQGTFPTSESWAASREGNGGRGAGKPCREGMRCQRAAPHSLSIARASGNLLESSFVVVDRFNITALVFQKIGIVVVHLGVVGQSLHSWAAERNRSRMALAGQVIPGIPWGLLFSHCSFFKESLVILRVPCYLLYPNKHNSFYNPKLGPHMQTVQCTGTPHAPTGHKYVAAIHPAWPWPPWASLAPTWQRTLWPGTVVFQNIIYYTERL